MALDLNGLNSFNNEVAGEVIPKIIFEGYSTSILPIKTGIKHSEPLNIMDVDLVVQNGDCVSTPSGSLVATQKNITVQKRTSFDALCLDQLDRTYLGISALSPGSYNESFALAQNYTDMIINKMKADDDKFLWNEDSGSVYAGLGAQTTSAYGSVLVPAATGSFTSDNALEKIDAMIEAIPAEIADRVDLTLWMSVANFRKYVTGLRKANNYYFNPESVENRTGVLQMVYPFQNVKVVGTKGITGDRLCIMPDQYSVVGVDLVSDETSFTLFFDQNEDKLKHRLKSKLGVAVAFNEFVVTNDEPAQV